MAKPRVRKAKKNKTSRRVWTETQKIKMVAAYSKATERRAGIAFLEKHQISGGHIYQWRKQLGM